MATPYRLALAIALSAGALLALPPIHQDPAYHHFAAGPFWNVISNFPFLILARYGLRALGSPTSFSDPWERAAYATLLLGTAGVAFGSAYYHAVPNDDRLFWDRLPMAVIFTSMVASIIGERLSSRAGRLSLVPLLALGIASVWNWRLTGDLRLYALVQFGAMATLAVLVTRYKPRYTEHRGVWWLGLCYVVAKFLEAFDRPLAAVIATGGHPWKHLAAAAAMWFYLRSIINRVPLRAPSESPSPGPSLPYSPAASR